MSFEAALSVLIAIILALLASSGWPGAVFVSVWLSTGLWLVLSTRSRGLLSDASFLLTWPLYVALGR